MPSRIDGPFQDARRLADAAPMRTVLCMLLLAATFACGSRKPAKDPGPPPAADHQQKVREIVERLLDKTQRLDGPSTYRFEAPVPDRVASWHFEPEVEGRPRTFGYVHGWSVPFRVKPKYVGYPEQPESQRMAFFADGQLRGVFGPGARNAPLELDKWDPYWVDMGWLRTARAQPPR